MDDGSGGPLSGFSFSALPIGLGLSLGMNERAMAGYAGMTEAEKERIILRAKDAKSKEEMERIVSSLEPSEEEGSKELFSKDSFR